MKTLMKALKWATILSVLFLTVQSYASPHLGALRISLIEGDVQIKTEDTGEWVPASINMPLADGDRIWVPERGRTEVQMRDGTQLRLDEISALEVLTVEKESFQFYLTEGRVYAHFKGSRGSLLQIDTPVSSIRAYDRSIFGVDVFEDDSTDISVYKGSVYAESRDGRTKVDAGNTLSLKERAYADLFPLDPPDEWERWNTDRDRSLAERRPPSRHLPDELHSYAGDFEENGRWVFVRDYGYVWTPTVVVAHGWAPYKVGRWVWVRGDYVWISYEPWGWVPYHYGRWAFVPAVGWCWVPPVRGAVYWGPGFVGWIYTPTYVSWVPLAPREIYYGHGYYGPHSVNITQVNVTQINVQKVVYKNVHVRNSVTVIHRDTFVTGRHVEINVRENPFLREKVRIGRPDIKPEKYTVMPVVKEIPQAKRPPEQIREIKVKELKEKRPLVREREVSVLTPKTPPREMELKVREGKPRERDVERYRGRRSFEQEREKSREFKPSGKSLEKPDKPERPEPPDKRGERLRDTKPFEKEKGREGRSKDFRPPERESKERGAVEREMRRPDEGRPSPEREIEKPREMRSIQKGSERVRELPSPEREGKERGTVEREMRRPDEGRPSPEREVEKPREMRSIQKGSERVRELATPEREGKERGAAEKRVRKSGEGQPLSEEELEKHREPRR